MRQAARRAKKSWRLVRRLATSEIRSGGKDGEDAVAGGERLRLWLAGGEPRGLQLAGGERLRRRLVAAIFAHGLTLTGRRCGEFASDSDQRPLCSVGASSVLQATYWAPKIVVRDEMSMWANVGPNGIPVRNA